MGTDSSLEEKIRADIPSAQKERDQVKVDALRMALDAMHKLEVARTDRKNSQYGKPVTEEDRIIILDQLIKQRNESATLYRKGNRLELAEKEEKEIAILQIYLPARLNEEEIRSIVEELVAKNGPDFRKIMPLAIQSTRGRADGGQVQRIVKEATGA